MRVGSLFSGIGGFDLGFSGFDVRWQVERDGDCLKVLAKHWPLVRRYRDIHAVISGRHRNRVRHGLQLEPVDVMVGGFPCQDLSVTGKREGLGGARSGLFFVFMRAVRMLKPRVVLIENVPGLFSSQRGRDFYTVLTQLADGGFRRAFRVLDSQYFGVAQRRRRVFIIGCHRTSGLDPAAILFESAGGVGDSSARRKTRTHVAPCLESGANRTGGTRPPGSTVDTAESLIAFGWNKSASQTMRVGETTDALQASGSSNPAIFEASSGERARALTASMHKRHDEDTDTLIAFDTTNLTSRENRANPQPGDPCHSLSAGAHPPKIIGALQAKQSGWRIGGDEAAANHIISAFQRCAECEEPDVCASMVGACARRECDQLDSHNGSRRHQGALTSRGVRRLTPMECERLQGFPDGWTCLCGVSPYSTATCTCSDSYRYRALGNAVTVPVIAWIAQRLRAEFERAEGDA